MKTLCSGILLAAAALVSAGCSPTEKILSVDPTSIEMAAEAYKVSVAVESSSSWVFDDTDTAEWLTTGYDDTDPNLLSVSADINDNPNERTDSITIISGDGLSLIIPVRQSGMSGFLDVSPSALEPMAARGDTLRILTVSANIQWSLSLLLDEGWLTTERGAEENANTVTLRAKPLRSVDPRSATLVIRPTNESFAFLADSIEVVQQGIDLLVDSESMNRETYIIEIPVEGGETILSVLSRSPWSISTEASTDRVSINLTEGDADMENGIPVVVTVAPNTGTEEFTFTLIFESDGKEYEYRFIQADLSSEPEPEPTPEPEPEPEPEP